MDVASSLPVELESLASAVIDAAFKVHQSMGPGLLESLYQNCLCIEMDKRGIAYQAEVGIPVCYEGVPAGIGMRLDLLIEKTLIVEVKSIDKLLPIHQSQLLTYLKLADLRLGLLINFNVALFKQGVKRVIR